MREEDIIRKSVRDSINADVHMFNEPVKLSRTELEELGREAQFEYELTNFEKVEVNGGHWFGLYRFFTVPTQHCYCTKDDMYYILGMVKYTKDHQGKSFNTFYSDDNDDAMEYALQKEYEHMEMVYKELFGKEWDGKKDREILYREMDRKQLVGNYFYYYRMYMYHMKSYEKILGIK